MERSPAVEGWGRDEANRAWGGRFARGPAAAMEAINASIRFDQRLWRHDIAGSIAHAHMLGACGILAEDVARRLVRGLEAVGRRFEAEGVPVDPALEDIHMTVEAVLTREIGADAGRLHTARSRNDQVSTTLRLWTRDALDHHAGQLDRLVRVLAARALDEAATLMPGFTHLQAAQPVTLGHHLLAHAHMLLRDAQRLEGARTRTNLSPLGAAALAGTGFAVDRQMTADALGFAGPMANAMDAVSARDFVAEALFAMAHTGVSLSRMAEEIVLWASQPFGWVQLSDDWSTGSSIMPQKKNPDAAELVRGHAGRLIGLMTGFLATIKGLPLAYSKDMQDDKEPLFEAHDLLEVSLEAMAGMMETMDFRRDRMRAACAAGHLGATELADWLVREAGLPFRQAHHVVGRAVAAADAAGVALDALPAHEASALHPALAQADLAAICGLEAAVARRTSLGGTAPDEVRRRARALLEARP